ncbi:MAG: DUF1634 domain-containing protein [Thermoplasmata archaeon]|nr:DUF1634 domain-containing protein [Thermoplasmata archaeon]WII08366.1 DUF1634 domain-containing protein [Methanomassiliicoccales archaeon LGM-RCC1]
MNMNKAIAWTLRIGIVLGLILIVIGEFMTEGNPFLYYGVLILITSPMFAVVTAFIGLILEKDWKWAAVAGVVVAIVVSGAFLAMM